MIEFILKYWIEFLFSILLTLGGYLFKQIKKYKIKIDLLQDGMQVILKTKINDVYERVSNKKCITLYEKDLIVDIYNNYKKLGGNGFTTDLMEKINELPIKKDCDDNS